MKVPIMCVPSFCAPGPCETTGETTTRWPAAKSPISVEILLANPNGHGTNSPNGTRFTLSYRLTGSPSGETSTATGGVQVLDWIASSGKAGQAMRLPSGKPLTVPLDVDLGAAPPLFQRGYLSRMTCVAEIAR